MKVGEKYGCLEVLDEGTEHVKQGKVIIQYRCKCRQCGKTRYYTEETIRTEPEYCYRPVYISTKHTYSTKASNARYRKEQKYQSDETICFVDDKSELVPSEEYCDKWNKKRTKELNKLAEKEAAIIATLPRKFAANYEI